MSMISLDNLCLRYGETLAVRDASFNISAGEIVGIAGPNGAGKSSLVQAMLGLVTPSSGRVSIGGVPTASQRVFRRHAARIAYVPQKLAVNVGFPITVRQVAAMGQYRKMQWFAGPSVQQRAAVDAALAALGLTALQDRQFAALSGGQQQKTLVARALAQGSALIVLDEPFRGVDSASQAAIANVLGAHRARGGAVVLVHHGAGLLSTLCDRVVLVGDGRIVADDRPESLLAVPRYAALLTGESGSAAAEPTTPVASAPPKPVQSAGGGGVDLVGVASALATVAKDWSAGRQHARLDLPPMEPAP